MRRTARTERCAGQTTPFAKGDDTVRQADDTVENANDTVDETDDVVFSGDDSVNVVCQWLRFGVGSVVTATRTAG